MAYGWHLCLQTEVEQVWEARSEFVRRSQTADAAAARAAEARLSEARQRAVAAERERRLRDAAVQVKAVPAILLATL